MSAAKVKAQKIIDENGVVVFSTTTCPYCRAAKTLLDSLGAKYYLFDFDNVDDGSAIRAALKDINGQSSVPNIYIKQRHIGGNSDLQALKGNLKQMLQEAGAL